jgi:hypothetical protein
MVLLSQLGEGLDVWGLEVGITFKKDRYVLTSPSNFEEYLIHRVGMV